MKFWNVVVAATAAALLCFGVAAPASAAVAGKYLSSNGVNIRTSGLTTAASVGFGFPSHSATVYCVAPLGSTVNKNRLWWRHTNNTTGKSGYSSDVYMKTGGTGGTYYVGGSATC